MPPPVSNPDLWPFDLETGMQGASKVRNLPSKFKQARPFGFSNYSLCMRWTDRQTNRQTDGRKQRLLLIAPSGLPYGQRHNKSIKWTHKEVVGLNAKKLTEVTKCDRSVRTKPKISVFMSRSLITPFPDNKHIIITEYSWLAVWLLPFLLTSTLSSLKFMSRHLAAAFPDNKHINV